HFLQELRGTDAENFSESDYRFQAGANAASLEAAQHARADVSLLGDIGEGEAQIFTDPSRHAPDAGGKIGCRGRLARRTGCGGGFPAGARTGSIRHGLSLDRRIAYFR